MRAVGYMMVTLPHTHAEKKLGILINCLQSRRGGGGSFFFLGGGGGIIH